MDKISDKVFFLDGHFVESKNVIKSKLKQLGYTTSSVLYEGVTHVALGNRSLEGWVFAQYNHVVTMTESELYNVTRNVNIDQQFLIQEENSGESSLAESVRELLNADQGTIKLALEMVKTGGLPQGLCDDLLIISKTNDDLSIRTEAKKILLTKGPVDWHDLIKDKQIFSNIMELKQKETRKKLESTSKVIGLDLAAYLSFLLCKYFNRGAGFALSLKKHKWRLETLRILSKNGTLDFSAGIGYHNWKDDEFSWGSQKINTGIPFPSDHPDPVSITKLNLHNCKISAISNEIVVFINLEELDASHNALTSLHSSILKLQKLKRLDLSSNRMTEFPAVLSKIRNLEILDISKMYGNAPINMIIPDDFMANNPNCQIKQ